MSRLSIVVIVAALGLAGCGASTKITSSWTAPDARPVRFAKVVVVFMNSAESTRRIAEDYLVDYIGSDRAVASHTLISQDEVQDTEAARATLEAENFDGAVVMRIIGSGEQIAYGQVPATRRRMGSFGDTTATAGPPSISRGICEPIPWSMSRPSSTQWMRIGCSGRV